MAEQRMARASGAQNATKQGGGGKSFGQKLFKGSSKLLGCMGSVAAGGVAAVAGGVSSVASKVGESVGSNAPSQTYTGGGYPQPQAGGLSSSLMERLAELEAQKKDDR